MSVGFGFSVGDFIAAINLVGTVIDALSASSKSSSELQELLRQLKSLQIVLNQVKSLEFDDRFQAELLALSDSAAHCQEAILAFLTKTASYQPHLLDIDGGSTSLQDKWQKIKWALCKRKDVTQLKRDLLLYTGTIQILLTVIQTKNVNLVVKNLQNLQDSITSYLQGGLFAYMPQFSAITGKVNTIPAKAQEQLNTTRRDISMNLGVFQIVLDVQNLLKNIPGQIRRQRPVYLNDAIGRHIPFHLEFITSSGALVSLLADKFKYMGRASEKIKRNQFSINDTRTKQIIDLKRPWESCFKPGQHVEMSMVFNTFKSPHRSCPGCHHPCDTGFGKDVEWLVSPSPHLGRTSFTVITQ
ncbi:MAG: hypothetical protein Q9212_005990 [Teloschistes hypoglaucus]